MNKNSDKLGHNPARIFKHTQWNFIEKAGLIKMNKSQYTQKTNDQQRETAEDPYIYIYICTERIRPGAKNETEARRRPHHSYMYKKNQKTQKKTQISWELCIQVRSSAPTMASLFLLHQNSKESLVPAAAPILLLIFLSN